MLLDTDVLIDVALNRQPFSAPACELLDRLQRGSVRAFIAWHTASNLYYLVSRKRGGAETREFLVDLLRFVDVAPVGTKALRYGASLPMRDFEDAMQVAAAHACGARYIVTRNVRDFRLSPIPAITPSMALEEYF